MTCVDELLEAVDDLSKMMRECDVSALEDDALAKLHRRVKQVNPQVQTFLHELAAKQICLKSKTDRLKGSEQVAKDHPEFVCPISHALMHDPVLAVDGHSYERRQIEALFDRGNTMIPITKINRMEMGTTLFPNITIKKAIERALEVELAAASGHELCCTDYGTRELGCQPSVPPPSPRCGPSSPRLAGSSGRSA